MGHTGVYTFSDSSHKILHNTLSVTYLTFLKAFSILGKLLKTGNELDPNLPAIRNSHVNVGLLSLQVYIMHPM